MGMSEGPRTVGSGSSRGDGGGNSDGGGDGGGDGRRVDSDPENDPSAGRCVLWRKRGFYVGRGESARAR